MVRAKKLICAFVQYVGRFVFRAQYFMFYHSSFIYIINSLNKFTKYYFILINNIKIFQLIFKNNDFSKCENDSYDYSLHSFFLSVNQKYLIGLFQQSNVKIFVHHLEQHMITHYLPFFTSEKWE